MQSSNLVKNMVVVPPIYMQNRVLAHPRRLETNTLTALTDSQLHRPTNDAALGCPLGFTFADEETALGAESITTLVTVKAALVPLTADSRDDDLFEDVLFTA